MQGLHLTADLFECADPLGLMVDDAALRDACLAAARQAGLTALASQFHRFGATEQPGGGVTGMVLLAESHLAVHTWPEQRAVTLDVYVCNFRHDNSDKARAVCSDLAARFQPRRREEHRLWRGSLGGARE